MNNPKSRTILSAKLWEASTYLIVLPIPLDLTTEYLAYSIALMLISKQKNVAFFIPSDYDKFAQKRIAQKLTELNLSIASQLLTTNYTISIDYEDGAVDSVSYDTKGGKFLLHITPTTGKKFDFNSVSFSERGGAFEQVIYCGSVEQTNLIRQQYPDLNKMTESLIIDSLTNLKKSICLNKKTLNVSILEIIIKLYESIKNSTAQNVLQQILTNLLVSFLALKNLQPVNTNTALASAINKLAREGANMNIALDIIENFHKKGSLSIYKQIFQNLQIDHKNDIQGAIIEQSNEQDQFLQSGNWLIDHKFLMNLFTETKLSWLGFISVNKTYIVIRSENIDLTTLINSGYRGTNNKGIWIISEVLRESILAKVNTLFTKLTDTSTKTVISKPFLKKDAI